MNESSEHRRRIAVVTGSRAEFGLLEPVMRALRDQPRAELLVIIAGAHLLPPSETHREVAETFDVAATVPMQSAGETGRLGDARALGRGVVGFADALERLTPEWIVVLGDRIEPFAAASAANVGGFHVAHIHGGDRATGTADDSIRHAITKLAHLHLSATQDSADRLIRMGERPEHVHTLGSPAIDGLDETPPMRDEEYDRLGRPEVIVLMHPIGRSPDRERADTEAVLRAVIDRRVLALHPNHDAGREGVLVALRDAAEAGRLTLREHMPRRTFVGLLKRLAEANGALVGNSSAALIEAAALRLPSVDIGPRQAGRERPANVMPADAEPGAVAEALDRARSLDRASLTHPYGDGRAGARIASLLVDIDPATVPQRKQCAY